MPMILRFFSLFALLMVRQAVDSAWQNVESRFAPGRYTSAQTRLGEEPFRTERGKPAAQGCLFLDNAALANARVAAPGLSFPIFENKALPEVTPRDGTDVVRNAWKVFDDIVGVGQYRGPVGIGNYLAVPHSNVSGIYAQTTDYQTLRVTSATRISFRTGRTEHWKHLGPAAGERVEWQFDFKYFPCSARIQHGTVLLPDSTLQGFVDAGAQPGSKQQVWPGDEWNSDRSLLVGVGGGGTGALRGPG